MHKASSPRAEAFGRYTGEIAPAYRAVPWLAGAADLRAALAGRGAEVLYAGRHRTVLVPAAPGGPPLPLVVKAFGRQSPLKDAVDCLRGSKAQRTWRAAAALRRAGVGTPAPAGYLERWEGCRLAESYVLTEYVPGLRSFGAELIRLFDEDPECARFMELLAAVAAAVRAMHAAGFAHNDLGNQNILLGPAEAGAAARVLFVDLNRGRARGRPLSLRARARDLSRIYLPSELRRVFLEMYFDRELPPRAFLRWEAFYRGCFAAHTRTRAWRHPLRTRRGGGAPGLRYPPERDMWIWDSRSGQPISALRPADRVRHLPASQHLRVAAAVARRAVPVWREYRRLLAGAYSRPVDMAGRVGVAIEPHPGGLDRELELLRGLGPVPVLLRLYHHEGEAGLRYRGGVARRLRAEGHAVCAALVQSRQAALAPTAWEDFVGRALAEVAGCAEWIEAGHAINRVKWGLWSLREHRALLEAVARRMAEHPGLRWIGPAAIDFEYPFLAAALGAVPAGRPFHALSHHLYVDRRGAPETPQGAFATLEKLALARAIARQFPGCEDRLVVSEVNWPLRGTGVYSPVTSPYESVGPRTHDPSVDEDLYADYMLRYLLIACASGLVERVYWWRLAARGFGLVDDSDERAWRPRPAYHALRHWLAALGGARFERRLELALSPAAGGAGGGRGARAHALLFRAGDGREAIVAHASGGAVAVRCPEGVAAATDALGAPLPAPGPELALTGRPVYLWR